MAQIRMICAQTGTAAQRSVVPNSEHCLQHDYALIDMLAHDFPSGDDSWMVEGHAIIQVSGRALPTLWPPQRTRVARVSVVLGSL